MDVLVWLLLVPLIAAALGALWALPAAILAPRQHGPRCWCDRCTHDLPVWPVDCLDCEVEVDDWRTHLRLFHDPKRARGPEDFQ